MWITSLADDASGPEQSAVLEFWLGFDHTDAAALAARHRLWFATTPEQDLEIATRFGTLVAGALAGDLAGWAATAPGRLALILLLDQFSRNLFRGTAAAFAGDPAALALALDGLAAGVDQALPPLARAFFYMPLEHAESAEQQAVARRLFGALAAAPAPPALAAQLQSMARYADLHADIIARFGRFPHRNRVLGRASTPAEDAYLGAGGPTFGQ